LAASTVTQASEAAQRYASALFQLAEEKGALADVHRDLSAFVDLAKQSKDMTHLLTSPVFSRVDKTAALTEVARKAGMTDLLVSFIGTMAGNGRSQDILGAQSAFDTLYADHRGVQRVVVRTAKDMDAGQRARIEDILAKAVGGEVELTSEVDASLIGGIQLRIGSKLIDASLAAKLDRMNIAMKGA